MSGTGSPLRVLILSDLHFCKEEHEDASWLVHDNTGEIPIWSQLVELLTNVEEKIDLIICPGDITTRACPDSLSVAWEHLNELRKKLNIPVLAVATGNHDVESRTKFIDKAERRIETYCDLTENLKLLSPPYPLSLSEHLDDYITQSRVNYFGSDFIIHETDEYRLLIFNSCTRHRDDSLEFNRGSFSKAAALWLENEFIKIDFKNKHKVNILVCHHHPIKHIDQYGQFDEMYDGSILMDLLNRYGDWVVIHGHKHHARLVYFGPGNKRTPIFSAGTFSAHTKTIGAEFNNQFYIMNIESIPRRPPMGRLEAWNWFQSEGWIQARRLENRVFTGIGFGFHGSIVDLAEEIYRKLPLLKSIKWEELNDEFPNLKYLVPSDYDELIDQLDALNVKVDKSSMESLLVLQKVC